jgi:hypothetical protein
MWTGRCVCKVTVALVRPSVQGAKVAAGSAEDLLNDDSRVPCSTRTSRTKASTEERCRGIGVHEVRHRPATSARAAVASAGYGFSGVSVRRVLREASACPPRSARHRPASHCAPDRGLALTETGDRCEPLSPAAHAWTSVGALILADPVRREPADRDTHGNDAEAADQLLREAARQQGYRSPVEVDRAGQAAAVQMFWRALQIAPPERGTARRRGGRASGAGSTPNPRDAA